MLKLGKSGRAVALAGACLVFACGEDPSPVSDSSSSGHASESSGGTTTNGESVTTDDVTSESSTGDPNPACGDGVVDDGEACDDTGESETCNPDCSVAECGDGFVNATAGEACDDAGESETCNADCSVAECGDGVLNPTAGEACDDGGESATCNPDCSDAECGDGFVNATAGETCDDEGESATCDIDCSVPECGDGVLNETVGEACDDAGESAACNPDCSDAECGDGFVNETAGETCDDEGESATCDTDCSVPECGDGVLNETAGEACDDAGESATCNPDCSVAECGDGIVNETAGETCDDEGESATCDTDCSAPECGDGFVNALAGETCDDANGGPGDGCDQTCNVELYSRCVGEGIGSCQSIRILYAAGAADDAAYRGNIAAQTGGPVDYFDARVASPTLPDLLANYDCVWTHPNDPYASSAALGTVLAAFVDAGGAVALGIATGFDPPMGLAGTAIMEPAYSPVATAGTVNLTGAAYNVDGTSVLYSGVNAFGGFATDQGVVVQGAGVADGTLSVGEPAGAYRPDFRVVYLNGAGHTDVSGTGQWGRLTANACAAAWVQ